MVTRLVWMLMFAALTASSGFSDSILISGNAMNPSPEFLSNLALLDGSPTITYVASQNLAATPLAGFDLVWLDGFSQFNDLSTLEPYLDGGGRVLVQNPGVGSEPLSAYPDTAGLGVAFTYPPGVSSVRILLPNDFVNFGLTDSSLSGWGPSAYGEFTGISDAYLGLTDTGTSGEYVTILQVGGPGVLVYTQQGISQFLQNNVVIASAPQLQFLDNLLPSTASPEPRTLALFLVPAGLLALRRKKARLTY